MKFYGIQENSEEVVGLLGSRLNLGPQGSNGGLLKVIQAGFIEELGKLVEVEGYLKNGSKLRGIEEKILEFPWKKAGVS